MVDTVPMSTHTTRSRSTVRLGTSQGALQVSVNNNPFLPGTGEGEGFTITVTGGEPPYHFGAFASPPNPPGVVITPNGNTCHVTCPAGTPSGTMVRVHVSDSATPPNRKAGKSTTA